MAINYQLKEEKIKGMFYTNRWVAYEKNVTLKQKNK